MLKAQEAGRDGQAKLIESTFTPPTFAVEVDPTAQHQVHDRSHL